MDGHRISLLGAGLVADFYAMTLHGQRSRDRVQRGLLAHAGARRGVPGALGHRLEHDRPRGRGERSVDTDVVIVALPNFLHVDAVELAAAAGKPVLCTKPLGRTADEAQRMLEVVERAGVFAGYLEDLCYTPKALKAAASVAAGAIGEVTWVRSREAHPGPHSAWFWDGRLTGGGAIVDLGCHCIEVIRTFVGKGNRPVEVLCHTDTLVHPIADEDNAIALIRFESGAIGQFEVSWTFRGGMDLRDEVAGTRGTIWMNHGLRTGLEMFTTGGAGGYVAEKAESSTGWLFPVGDEASEFGYVDMFSDMFRSLEAGVAPRETFYDGYVVNAVMDAAYRSARARRGCRSSSTGGAGRPPGSRPPRRCSRGSSSSSARSCRTGATSSSSRIPRPATSPTAWSPAVERSAGALEDRRRPSRRARPPRSTGRGSADRRAGRRPSTRRR